MRNALRDLRNKRVLSIAAVFCGVLSTIQPALADQDRFIVRFAGDDNSTERVAGVRAVEAAALQQIDVLPVDNSVVVRMERDAARALIGKSGIQYIEVDRQVRAQLHTDDPLLAQQYSLEGAASSNVTSAWDTSVGSPTKLVAVIDSGADLTHPDLAANIWTNPNEIPGNGRDDDRNGYRDDVNGYDFVNKDSSPQDDYGHGSHVAGIVAAVGNNTTGVAGVAWGTKVVVLKALDDNGSGYVSDIAKALDYLTDLKRRGIPIHAANLSLGGGTYSSALYRAIERARNYDILVMAAAGNTADNNDTQPSFPANFKLDNIISVAATDENAQLAGYSNYGPGSVHLAAPGSGIVNVALQGFYPDLYTSMQGTSMASPHVMGIAALIAAANPNLSALQVRSVLLSSVRPLTMLSGLVITGGISDASHGVATALETAGLTRLFGVVRQGSKGISGVSVRVRSRSDSNVRRTARTAKDGSYSVSELPVGSYAASVSKRGIRFRAATFSAKTVGTVTKNFKAVTR
jgi:subtilisin family serine protease